MSYVNANARPDTHMNHSWRRIKHDFLHHFHKPRLDLLAWILIDKLAPGYYNRLDSTFAKIGRFRELPSWRRDFKRAWNKAVKTPFTGSLNPGYRPQAHLWVCTCPSFVTSRFLLCKHLVQSVQPVPPIFFLEATRNRRAPFWSHPALVPLEMGPAWLKAAGPQEDIGVEGREGITSHEADDGEAETDEERGASDDDMVDTEGAHQFGEEHVTVEERIREHVRTIRAFCDGLDYQVQFRDRRMLDVLEKDGSGFLRLAKNCLSRERQMSSVRGKNPATWERGMANTMFYRTRPNPADAG